MLKLIYSSPGLSSQDMMVEELKNLLDIYQPEKNKLDIRKTPEMYITLKSTPDEVRDWLKAKEFDIVYVIHSI
jgi:epidermal growth factor receptor kinase substrate 8